MENNSLNKLASELKIASVTHEPEVTVMGMGMGVTSDSQSDIFGGSISSVVVTPSDFPMSEVWSNLEDVFGGSANNSGSDDYRPGYNPDYPGSNNPRPGENINDRYNFLMYINIVIDKELNKPEATKEYKENLQRVQRVIERMKNSALRFRIQAMPDYNNTPDKGAFGYDPTTEEVVIMFEPRVQTDFPLVAHEFIHVEQILNGEMRIEGGEIIGYDIWDEVEAYQFQHDLGYPDGNSGYFDWNGNPVPGGGYRITPDIVYGLDDFYRTLPDAGWSKPSGGSGNGGNGGGIGGGGATILSASRSASY